jgi:TIR domain
MAGAVFLSYRRDISSGTAKLVRDHLTGHGFDVFMDTASLGSGAFTTTILEEIAARPHFVLLLEARSLDRVHDDGDWLRREIAHALATGRNVVPITTGSTPMPAADALPTDIAAVAGFNALPAPWEYFDEALARLRNHFLRVMPPPHRPPELESDPLRLSVGRYNTLLVVTWAVQPQVSYHLQMASDPDVWPGFPRLHLADGGRSGRYATALAHDSPRQWYRVCKNAPGEPWSRPVQIPAPPPPDAPFVTVRFGVSGAKVTWAPIPGARAYVVQCSVGTGFAPVIRSERVGRASHTDRSGRGGTHAYRVRALFDGDRTGAWSEPAID